MTTHEHDHSASNFSPEQFQRLADGELGEAERRQLLARLDDEPDGWRRCALAFLESQCLREALGPLGEGNFRETTGRVPDGAEARAMPRRHATWSRNLAAPGAVAAGLLVAFIAGVAGGPYWHFFGDGGGGVVSTMPVALQSPLGPVFPAAKVDGRGLSAPWQTVTVSVPGGERGGRESVRLPAMEREQIDDGWLDTLPEMPQQVIEALRRSGHQVRQSRQLLPIPMDDGRRLVIPVDEIDVHDMRSGAYQ